METVAIVAIGIFAAVWLSVGFVLAWDHHQDVKRCALHLRAHEGTHGHCGECWRCWGVMHEGQG